MAVFELTPARRPNAGSLRRIIRLSDIRSVRLWCLAASAIFMAMACRSLDPRYACVTRPYSLTKLVADSPEVRRLLAAAPSRDMERDNFQKGRTQEEQIQLNLEMTKHPEQYLADRMSLIDSIGRQRGVLVEGQQYFRVLEQSDVGCDLIPIHSAVYIRVRVTTGPHKDREGWACDLDVQPTGAWVV